jgi:hypothetical protein
LEHPGFIFTAPFTKPPLTFNDASGDIAFYAAPNRISTSNLDRILYPGFWGELATFILALVFVWWRFGPRRSRRRGSRGDGARPDGAQADDPERLVIGRAAWAVGIIGALGPVAMLLAWQGDGQEVTRHMVEGSIEMRLGILLVLLIAALGRTSDQAADEAAGHRATRPVASAI